MTDFNKPEEVALNPIQPVSDDFSTDGYLSEFAKVDHQHPLSESLRSAIFNAGVGTYVRKTGDTMTGNLIISGASILISTGNAIYFNYPTNTNLIYTINAPAGQPYHTGLRIQCTDGWSFYNNTQGADVMGYRGAAGMYGWFNSKVYIGGPPNDPAVVQMLTVNGHIAITSNNSLLWYNGTTQLGGLWMAAADWVRATPNFYTSGILGCNGGVAAGGSGGGMAGYTGLYCPGTAGFSTTYFSGHVYGQGIMFQSTRIGTLAWGDSDFFANPASGRAMYGFHPGGVAGNLRMDQSFASYMCTGTSGTEYYSVSASAFAVGSQRKLKQDIADWPPKPGLSLSADEQPIKAMDIVRELNIVSYKLKEQQFMAQTYKTERRNQAHARLNRFRENRGLDPYLLDIHTCDDPICDGSLESPCGWRKNWQQDTLGLIVEDTVGIAPEIVQFNKEGEPGFIDVHSHVSLLHAAIKELEERIYFLERIN